MSRKVRDMSRVQQKAVMAKLKTGKGKASTDPGLARSLDNMVDLEDHRINQLEYRIKDYTRILRTLEGQLKEAKANRAELDAARKQVRRR